MQKIQWHYNKDEGIWYYSPDEGKHLWIIDGSWTFKLYPESRCGGYEVKFLHLQGNSYGWPMPIFHCRYLKEAKAFVQLCVNSQTIPSQAWEFIHFPGKYGAQNNP